MPKTKVTPTALPPSPAWTRIYYGYYEINHAGTIRRVKSASGTHPGRILKPYNVNGVAKVNLSRPDDEHWTVSIAQLRRFRKTQLNKRLTKRKPYV